MNTELNEVVAKALGWSRRSDGEWLNYWGAEVRRLPDFSGNVNSARVVVMAFEPSLQTRMDGRYEAFHAEYRNDMLPTEICDLAVRVTRRLRPDLFR